MHSALPTSIYKTFEMTYLLGEKNENYFIRALETSRNDGASRFMKSNDSSFVFSIFNNKYFLLIFAFADMVVALA